MLCDMAIAAENAKFGQPEIKLRVIPGWGLQPLTRAVGTAKAMEMCLTGRTMDVEDAEHSGLVARVVPDDVLLADMMVIASCTDATVSTPARCCGAPARTVVASGGHRSVWGTGQSSTGISTRSSVASTALA